MNKVIAVIDLGTNTFNLLIAETGDGKGIERKLYAHEFPVKLGEGGINQGYITPEAFQRGLSTIREINTIIKRYKAEKVVAVATSAIRSTTNGNEFIQTIKTETGISISTIDGEREAELIYRGVRASAALQETAALIMDIGGGSVEFIICNSRVVFWKKSYPIGAARLKEKFHRSDPISKTDVEAVRSYLADNLIDLFEQVDVYQPAQLIGSAGAFQTFSDIMDEASGRRNTSVEVEYSSFNMDLFYKISDDLLQSNQVKRENMPGLIAFRVDMIVIATILTRYILERTGIKKMLFSSYSLKEGLLTEEIG